MIKKFFSTIAGIIVIIIGLLGIFLPLLPGWLLIFAGIAIINPAQAKLIANYIKRKLKICPKENEKEDPKKSSVPPPDDLN